MTTRRIEDTMETTMTTTNPTPPCRDCEGSGRIRKVTIGKPPEANAETVACLCQGAYDYSAAELAEAFGGPVSPLCRDHAREIMRERDAHTMRTLNILLAHDFTADSIVIVDQVGHRRCALPKWTGDVMPPDVARLRDGLFDLAECRRDGKEPWAFARGFPMVVDAFRRAEHERRNAAQAEVLGSERRVLTAEDARCNPGLCADPRFPIVLPDSVPVESRTVDGYHRVAPAPVDNPYADERARASARAVDLFHQGVLADCTDPADPRASIAAVELRESGVDVSRFTTGDLVAHYDQVIGPRASANLARQRAAKVEEAVRRALDRAPEPDARHDGSDTPTPEPAPEPEPERPEIPMAFGYMPGTMVVDGAEVERLVSEGLTVVGYDRAHGESKAAWVKVHLAPDGKMTVLDSGEIETLKSTVDEATGEALPMIADRPIAAGQMVTDADIHIRGSVAEHFGQRPRTFAVGDRVRIVAPDSPGTGTVRSVDGGMYGVDDDEGHDRRAYGWPALEHLIEDDTYRGALTRDEAWQMRLDDAAPGGGWFWARDDRPRALPWKVANGHMSVGATIDGHTRTTAAPGLKVPRSVYEPLALIVADRSGETMVRERNERRGDVQAEPPRSRIPEGLREFLTAEFDANRLDFCNVADTVARFDPTIAVLGVEFQFCGNSITANVRCCSRGMTDNYDVELTFDCDPRAPAPARIPDDSLLAIIAGKDGER